MNRYAIVSSARTRSEAEAYLPDNYKVIHEFTGGYISSYDGSVRRIEGDNVAFVIQGEDKAGWTLDGYVIPRYASGLIGCQEIDLSHPVMKQIVLGDPKGIVRFGICVDHHCDGFERRVPAIEGDRCEHCGQLLMHESGLTWADAKAVRS